MKNTEAIKINVMDANGNGINGNGINGNGICGNGIENDYVFSQAEFQKLIDEIK